MPLPLPLLGAALALTGGVYLSLRHREAEEGEPAAQDPLPYRLAFARHRVAQRLHGLAELKLYLWQHTLRDFAELRARLTGLSGKEAALWLLNPRPGDDLPPDAPRVELPPPTEEDLRRILQIAAEVDDWDRRAPPGERWLDRLPPVDLADLAARGLSPEDPAARDGTTDCPSLGWLIQPDAPPPEGPMLGGVRLSAAARQALLTPGTAAASADLELRAVMGLLESLEALLEEVAGALDALRERAGTALAALALQVHLNPDYDRMADVPMTGELESPRQRVEHSHQLAAVMLALLEVPLLDAEGRLNPEVPSLLDAHAVLIGRIGIGGDATT